MKFVLLLSAAILGASAAVAAAAPCGHGHRRHCVIANTDTMVDLSSVSDISKKIVAEEPVPAAPKRAPDSKPAPYTGPTLGVAPLPRAPTVGYKWSLE